MRLSLAFLLACLTIPIQAKTWHVSPGSPPGISKDSLVHTIGQAAGHVAPGDTVLIHGGVYREKVVLKTSGQEQLPILFKAVEGDHVVVTGTDRITDWESVAEGIVAAHWPHRFITWNEHNTHPSDPYHRLIGRCEQVFINGYALQQVLQREQLGRGTFFVDLPARRLYLSPDNGMEVTDRKSLVEASVRDRIFVVEGHHIRIEGIRFRYAANRAQQGAVEFTGDDLHVRSCIFETTNASGAEFKGQRITVENCTFQFNGQLGFGANRAHDLRIVDCTIHHNNTKNFNRGWEASGNKLCLSRDVVIEHSTFTENRGHGIWFDIGNENAEIHNCFIAHNENAGIFYEISYGLHAHDNVILANGFAFTPGAWGAAAGISLSSSPGCTVERNLLIGNREGFNFREQERSTPRIDGEGEEHPLWNHDETVRNNTFAFNRDAQVWGWFDIADQRHWPRSMQMAPVSPSTGLSLEALNLHFSENLYWPGPGHDLFNWGVTWKRNESFKTLETLQQTLSLDQDSRWVNPRLTDIPARDLRVPPDSPALRMHCYPQGDVPGVRLGVKESQRQVVPTGVTFHRDTIYRSEHRGDNWCITWAADDSQVTSMCDGNWLGSKQSYHNHLYRILEGPDAFFVEDVPGYPQYVWNTGSWFGYGIVSVDSVLYSVVSKTPADRWSGPFRGIKLLKSTDQGASWTRVNRQGLERKLAPEAAARNDVSPDEMFFLEEKGRPHQNQLAYPFSFVDFVKCGRDNSAARDDYLYIYAPEGAAAHELLLARVPKEKLGKRSAWQYFQRYQHGQPVWTANLEKRGNVHVFPEKSADGNHFGWYSWLPSVVWNPGLGLYIMVNGGTYGGHGMSAADKDYYDAWMHTETGSLGFWYSEHPYGPWKRFYYTDYWVADSEQNRTYQPKLSPKWISADGRQMILIWSDAMKNEQGRSHTVNYKWNHMQITLDVPSQQLK